VASIPPKLSVADFVKTIKGGSSYHLNQYYKESKLSFAWQQEYGVLTLGSKQLEDAKAYVNNQKQHHSQGTIISALEANFNE
jgi:putative transposase